MSTLHINQIQQKITDLFSKDLDVSQFDRDPEKEDKIFTQYLAAYAVYSTNECSIKEATDSVVDWWDDNWIDAIFYSQQSKIMTIVQSKWRKNWNWEPDSASIAKFSQWIKDLFDLNFERFNVKIKNKSHIIESAIKEFWVRYELILIDTCTANWLAIHSQRIIDDLLQEMNNIWDEYSEKSVRFSRLNQSKIYTSLASSARNDPINLEIWLSQWGIVNEPYKAYYGMISWKELADWWLNYNTRLFEKNIRQVLWQTDVNDEIEITLDENPNLFWYFNNWITIIADKIEKTALWWGSKDFWSFKLTNIAIVNWAQTVSTIGKFSVNNTEKLLDNVKVSIRIIQLSDTPENFWKDVTKTNNRQNKIENKDFVSQDPEQIRIKTELQLDWIEYNIMRSESNISSNESIELNEATISLACASWKTSLVVQAKWWIGKYYENLEKGIYKELFNISTSWRYVLNCVKTIRCIETVLKSEIEKLWKYSGRDYGLLVHGNRIIELLVIIKLWLVSNLRKINYELNESSINDSTLIVIKDLKNYLESNFAENILGTLFKNSTKCTTIVDNLKSI